MAQEQMSMIKMAHVFLIQIITIIQKLIKLIMMQYVIKYDFKIKNNTYCIIISLIRFWIIVIIWIKKHVPFFPVPLYRAVCSCAFFACATFACAIFTFIRILPLYTSTMVAGSLCDKKRRRRNYGKRVAVMPYHETYGGQISAEFLYRNSVGIDMKWYQNKLNGYFKVNNWWSLAQIIWTSQKTSFYSHNEK